jgi:4-amino-4-deoxy-L-arabinose transferase-like glycosyltransferase
MENPPPSLRREAAIVALMTVIGAILRFWGPGRLGLNHFDEGIYALAGLWIQSPRGIAGISPEVVAYAPPLFPILVGVSYMFLGISDVSAILVSQVCGVLTIPAVAWVGRRTFGPGAGAAAAALCAISGPHIAFSRMALTDSTFLLCWVLAFGFGGRFLERPGLLRAIPFGLMVGLAQNAKYNGYLAGGIVALAGLWAGMVPRGSDPGLKRLGRTIGFGAIAAALAGVVYLPWYRFVEVQPGGYSGLIEHHRGYLTGTSPSAWAEHWRLQMGQSFALSGELTQGLTWGIIAWPLAWIGGLWCAIAGENSAARSRRRQMRDRLGLFLGAAVLGIAPNAGWWIALAMLPWWLASRSVSTQLIACGWLVMAILTPMYHPYSRLWLPLQAFGWIALAGLVRSPAERGEAASPGTSWSDRLRPIALALAIVAAVVSDAVIEPRARSLGSPIGPTDGQKIQVGLLAARINTGSPANPNPGRLLLLVRPSTIFYLLPQIDRAAVRLSDPASLVLAARKGDDIVFDYRVIDSSGQVPSNFWDLINRGMATRRMQNYILDEPPVTWADQQPGAVFDRLMTRHGGFNYVPVRLP